MTTATPTFLFVDLFAGAGGTTTGAEQSGVCRVLAAVNHDPVAISSHSANHPHVEHFVEDIRTLDTSELVRIVSRARARHPHAKLVLWGSPDCTHFSRAKSGPKNRDTRSLADEMPRYARALQPDYIKVENVEEFTSWGPLDDAGRPISRHEGRDYMRWVQSITSLGYHYQYRILNAADYGAHTRTHTRPCIAALSRRLAGRLEPRVEARAMLAGEVQRAHRLRQQRGVAPDVPGREAQQVAALEGANAGAAMRGGA